MENENNAPLLYELIDENGEKHEFEKLGEMEYEGDWYVALTPFFEEDEVDELLDDSCEVVILKSEVDEETGEEMFASIEDDELYEKIGGIFVQQFAEMFEFDDEDEDECGCGHCHHDHE